MKTFRMRFCDEKSFRSTRIVFIALFACFFLSFVLHDLLSLQRIFLIRFDRYKNVATNFFPTCLKSNMLFCHLLISSRYIYRLILNYERETVAHFCSSIEYRNQKERTLAKFPYTPYNTHPPMKRITKVETVCHHHLRTSSRQTRVRLVAWSSCGQSRFHSCPIQQQVYIF